MAAHWLDDVIEAYAADHHGAFARRTALAAGASDHMIRARVRSGRWRRVAPGVYVLRSWPRTFTQRAMCATLVDATGAASHRTAAALRRFTGIRPGRLEIVVPVGRNTRSALTTIHRSRLPIMSSEVDGIPVTTAAQTLVDLAPTLSYRRIAEIADDLLAANAMSIDDLSERTLNVAARRRKGFRALAAVIDTHGEGAGAPRSELERALHRVLDHPDMPRYVTEAPAPWSPGGPQRVDVLIPGWKLIIEADSRRWHTRVADFERDRERDQRAVAAGFRVLRFTWDQLVHHPEQVRAVILATGAWSVVPERAQ